MINSLPIESDDEASHNIFALSLQPGLLDAIQRAFLKLFLPPCTICINIFLRVRTISIRIPAGRSFSFGFRYAFVDSFFQCSKSLVDYSITILFSKFPLAGRRMTN